MESQRARQEAVATDNLSKSGKRGDGTKSNFYSFVISFPSLIC